MLSRDLQTPENFVGVWSGYRSPSVEDKLAFAEATREIIGIDYKPYAVAEQLVSGVNYRFKCIASIPPYSARWEVALYIFKPLDRSAYIVGSDHVISTLAYQIVIDETLATAIEASLKKARNKAKDQLNNDLFNVINEEFDQNGWPLTTDKYLKYLSSFSRMVPNEVSSEKYPTGWKSSPGRNGHNQKIYDLLCHFYWLINQEVEIEGELMTLQGYENGTFQFAEWIVDFNKLWGHFLNTSESLTEQSLESFKNDPPYHVNDSSEYIDSWKCFNDFFYRQLNGAAPDSGISPLRPIVEANNNKVITSPADCTYHEFFKIDEAGNIPEIKLKHTHKVASVKELLEDSEYGNAFNNGTYIHYFLSPFDYHRFHIPVSGRVLECKKVIGKDYLNVELTKGQFDAPDGAKNGYEFTQARGVLIIDTAESGHGNIGKVAIIPVGMAQVSSVHMYTNLVGQNLDKGYEFGKFAFGGSDIIMLFEQTPDLYLNNYSYQNPEKQIHFKYGEASVLWNGLYNFSTAQLSPIPNEVEPPLYLLTISGRSESANPEIDLINTQIIDEGYLLIQVSGKDRQAIGTENYIAHREIQKIAGTAGVKVVGKENSVILSW